MIRYVQLESGPDIVVGLSAGIVDECSMERDTK